MKNVESVKKNHLLQNIDSLMKTVVPEDSKLLQRLIGFSIAEKRNG